MNQGNSNTSSETAVPLVVRFFHGFMVPYAYSIIMAAALFCTLAVKLYHSFRYDLLSDYIRWILSDVAFLLILEAILTAVCFRWPLKWVVRAVTIISALVCTWSVINAGWIIRTGTQILPRVLLPIFRAPINALCIIGVNLVKMPVAAFTLLAPSAVALAFFFYVLVRPRILVYDKQRFYIKTMLSLMIVFLALLLKPALAIHGSPNPASIGLRYNSQIKAITSLFAGRKSRTSEPSRKMPYAERLDLHMDPDAVQYNLIVVVLEGVQYKYTSFVDEQSDLTPFLKSLAEQGIMFSSVRSTLSHTTKALFSLSTGRYPSASQDLAEAIPVSKPYASIASILKDKLNYRTAFIQSALGNFESRPGLVSNLGFEHFITRDDLDDPNSFVGYLGCDEFSMLKTIVDWIEKDERPFFLTYLCSVTHDPYEVPVWFNEPAKEPIDRYKQAIFYTDKFLAALDVELSNMNISNNTIFCVIGDHGEAFGEHGQLGHALISYDEVLRIPFCIRAPFLVDPGTKIDEPVSSVDMAPTVLSLMGFDTSGAGFNGMNMLGAIPDGRKVYFSGWMQEGPAGYVMGNRKFIYDPTNEETYMYDLKNDPGELNRIYLFEDRAQEVMEDVIAWRESTILKIDQNKTGRKLLFNKWQCRWTNRISSSRFVLND